MVRTVIALEQEDKNWLDRESRRRGISMTELVREAVRTLREQQARSAPGFDELLVSTSGSWPGPDGLEYQRRIREDWTRDEE